MWTKLDDGFYDHPKILSCSLEAIGLHTLALSYCGRHLTGGEVPKNVPFLQGRSRLVKELVRAGLWDPTETGWAIHDWASCNPTREEAREYQRRMQEVRRQGGKARAATASRVAGQFAPASTSNPADQQPPAVTSPVPVPVPSTNKKDQYGAHAHSNGNGQNLASEQRALIRKKLLQLQATPRSQRDRLTMTMIGDLVQELRWSEDEIQAALATVAEEMQ